MTIWFELLGEGVTRIETVLFVFLAVSMVIAGGFTVGMIFAFLAYKGQFLDAGLRFADLVADWKTLDTHVDRIADIALEPPEYAPPSRPDRKSAGQGKRVSVRVDIGGCRI